MATISWRIGWKSRVTYQVVGRRVNKSWELPLFFSCWWPIFASRYSSRQTPSGASSGRRQRMPDFLATTLSFKYILEVIAAEANSGRIWSYRTNLDQRKGARWTDRYRTAWLSRRIQGKSARRETSEAAPDTSWMGDILSVLWKIQKLKCNVLQAWKLTAENTWKGDYVSYLFSALTNFSYKMRAKSEIGLPPHLLIAPDPKARLQAPFPFVFKQIRKNVPMTYRMVSSRER